MHFSFTRFSSNSFFLGTDGTDDADGSENANMLVFGMTECLSMHRATIIQRCDFSKKCFVQETTVKFLIENGNPSG